jgi:hypothetical protein
MASPRAGILQRPWLGFALQSKVPTRRPARRSAITVTREWLWLL